MLIYSKITLNEIIGKLNPISTILNRRDVEILDVIKLNEDNKRDDVIFWINLKNIDKLKVITNGTIILPQGHDELCTNKNCNYLIFENPRLAFKNLITCFFIEKAGGNYLGINSTIHPTVILPSQYFIGNNVTISSNCKIGHNISIGHNTVIYPNTIIDSDVIIGANCTIGGVGFGYEKNSDKEFELIPHIGGVHIKSSVEIGNNTCIDRAVLEYTIIGKGSKIDNLVHIAHNVIIGENCAIVAHSIIGGSTIVADESWIAPNATIRDGIVVGKNSIVGMGAVVTKSIPSHETWIGNPAKSI